MNFARFALAFAALVCLGQDAANPWTKSELIEPATLAAALNTPKRPMVISVAFPVLYRNRHIVGALDAGAASKPEGIEALRKLVSAAPKDAQIVVYCGCCPMDRCPNVRPAFRVLKEMGYRNVKVLNIPTNMSADWYAKNYPSEPGSAAPGAK
jgi:thiosulfate/3-mercaptopyruvate sulfurtransferase